MINKKIVAITMHPTKKQKIEISKEARTRPLESLIAKVSDETIKNILKAMLMEQESLVEENKGLRSRVSALEKGNHELALLAGLIPPYKMDVPTETLKTVSGYHKGLLEMSFDNADDMEIPTLFSLSEKPLNRSPDEWSFLGALHNILCIKDMKDNVQKLDSLFILLQHSEKVTAYSLFSEGLGDLFPKDLFGFNHATKYFPPSPGVLQVHQYINTYMESNLNKRSMLNSIYYFIDNLTNSTNMTKSLDFLLLLSHIDKPGSEIWYNIETDANGNCVSPAIKIIEAVINEEMIDKISTEALVWLLNEGLSISSDTSINYTVDRDKIYLLVNTLDKQKNLSENILDLWRKAIVDTVRNCILFLDFDAVIRLTGCQYQSKLLCEGMNRIENLCTGMICTEVNRLTYLEPSNVQNMSLKNSKIKNFIIALINNGVKFRQDELNFLTQQDRYKMAIQFDESDKLLIKEAIQK